MVKSGNLKNGQGKVKEFDADWKVATVKQWTMAVQAL